MQGKTRNFLATREQPQTAQRLAFLKPPAEETQSPLTPGLERRRRRGTSCSCRKCKLILTVRPLFPNVWRRDFISAHASQANLCRTWGQGCSPSPARRLYRKQEEKKQPPRSLPGSENLPRSVREILHGR